MQPARAVFVDTHLPQGAARRGLDHWIREHPEGLSLAEAVPILRAVAGLLATSHAVRQLFRTLTPAELAYDGLTRTAGLDLTRVIPGRDLRYASPEVIEDIPPDVRDDVFSFACIAYELLSGRHPYDGALATEALAAGRRPRPIAALSEPQNAALARGLALHRRDRTETVGGFLRALLMPSPARLLATPRRRPLRPRRDWASVALTLCGVGLLAFGVLNAWDFQRAPSPPANATAPIAPAPAASASPEDASADLVAVTDSAAFAAQAPTTLAPAVAPQTVHAARAAPRTGIAPAETSPAAGVGEFVAHPAPVAEAPIAPPAPPPAPVVVAAPAPVVAPAPPCPQCDCLDLRNRRDFSHEILRPHELAFLDTVCRRRG